MVKRNAPAVPMDKWGVILVIFRDFNYNLLYTLNLLGTTEAMAKMGPKCKQGSFLPYSGMLTTAASLLPRP
jgi:hypothetical protein